MFTLISCLRILLEATFNDFYLPTIAAAAIFWLTVLFLDQIKAIQSMAESSQIVASGCRSIKPDLVFIVSIRFVLPWSTNIMIRKVTLCKLYLP